MNTTKKLVWGLSLVTLAGLLAIQAVPVERTNPPVRSAPRWDSPRTEALARRACYDCHSNETKWPAYARLAPVSWWVARHVRDGRRHLNFSEAPFREAEEAAGEVLEREMPLRSYTLAHPEARLSREETRELAAGLRRTFGMD